MITAIVMIKADVHRIPEVAGAIAEIDGVSEVYSVTGGVDLIAMVRVRKHEDLAEVIPGRVNKVPGVLSSDTHISFQAYSRHDLESAFALGW
ncbi:MULTISPECIES: Lrp/AsnC family transcriptional regulator [Nocardiopsis]|uniref:Transcriptional regulator, AsnC family n=3 Tax=Nocardiopsis TaxID=2013 RepID=D7B291_NOCDD|nr:MULTISPECIES: Lrp/AsnC ligand binding domain-containing protein [Nocardiopsis]PDP86342.1 AsnC family transcriptional regulator [Glycomyces fuscus]ADH68548.1 transcriptional regulator, AsnC family [Nocardiopsis dassonvillei subsp. dassonvillei DSM 43111]APC36626.1 AsnC family transcriptional regulator [Nocardiopsis dassonvillei]ASU59564.1 AsnC family transcriptional regulator [Nocardiopsis dassonvillei]MCK9869938.1 Lrp/AsnC ligand binding domain-containing protein [Nocardiopsis dassonvillei]